MMVEEEAQAIDNGGGGSLGSTCWQRRQPRQYIMAEEAAQAVQQRRQLS
jgi:hypothetical protein